MLKQIDDQVTDMTDGIVVPMQRRGTRKSVIVRNLAILSGMILTVGLFVPTGRSDLVLLGELLMVAGCFYMAIHFNADAEAECRDGRTDDARTKSSTLRDNLVMPRLGTLAVAFLMIVVASAVVPFIYDPAILALFAHAMILSSSFALVAFSFYVMGAPVAEPRI